MAKFRKLPVVIEAIPYTGENLAEVLAFTGKHPKWDEWFPSFEAYQAQVQADGGIFKILTLEGTMEATPGDWIIRGVKGEHYPCKPEIFEATYEPDVRPFEGMSFGDALKALKAGAKVGRKGWNGKGMWLALSRGNDSLEAAKFWAEPNRRYAEGMGGFAPVLPCITMKTATGEILMGWLASQTDMLAEDWEVVL